MTQKGIKINNDKSMFAKAAEAKHQFEDGADQVMAARNARNKTAFDLAQQFNKIINDKTLVENRGVIATNIEKEVESKLLNLAIDVNNDGNEPNEGMGSIALCAILFKVVLTQRDRINSLEYKVAKIEKQLVSSHQAGTPSDVKA